MDRPSGKPNVQEWPLFGARALRGIWSLIAGFCWVMAAPLPVSAAPVVVHETVALEGQPAPGGGPGETFGSLLESRPRVNASGDIAFIAPVLGIRPDGSPVSTLFLKTTRGLQRLAQEDTLAPGLDAPPFGVLSYLALNDAGSVAFLSQRGVTEAIFSNASGAWHRVADTLDAQPAGLRFQSFSSVATNFGFPLLLRSTETPEVLFPAESRTPSPGVLGFGLWTADADGWDPQALFRAWNPPPALPPEETLETLTQWGFGGEPARRSIFHGYLFPRGDPPVFTNLSVLWTRDRRGPLTVLVRSGDRVPAAGPELHFGDFSYPSVNGLGTVAFGASLVSEASGRTQSIFAGPTDALQLIVRDGDDAHRSDGTLVGNLAAVDRPRLNAAGQILFQAGVTDRPALLRWTPGQRIELVAMFGDSWPGAPAGWSIGHFQGWNFNAAGRVAFFADLLIPDQTTPAAGLWITDATGTPTLVAIGTSEPPTLTAPPGVTLLIDSVPPTPAVEPSGGTDGLHRILSDRHGVAIAGRRPDGLTGIFQASVDPDTVQPPDESFRLVRISPGMWAPVESSSPDEATLAHSVPLFPEDGLQARTDKDWTDARLRLEIEENLSPDNDLLGLDRRSIDRQTIAISDGSPVISHLGRPLGSLTRPGPGILEVRFDPQATTEGVRALIRTLAFGARRGVANTLLDDARHTEPTRRLRLRITDAGGRSTEGTQSVRIPSTAGLAFEGHGLDHQLWADGNRGSSQVTLRLQLLLTDGTRLTIGCAPTAADVQWVPHVAAENFRIESAGGTPCATASMTFSRLGGFPSLVRLHSWEALHVLRRERPLLDIFTQGPNNCIFTLLEFWVTSVSQPSPLVRREPAQHLARALTASGAPSDLLSGPYSLRAWMDRSDEGRRLIRLYEQHTGELVTLLLGNFGLLTEALSVVREFVPGLREFLAGNGARAVIREDMVAQLNRVCDQLAAAASPVLRQAIETERARFHHFEDFAGRSFTEWGLQLGLGSPATPFITASSPRLEPGAFTVEANRVNGQIYSLWRRPATRDGFWEAVTNGSVRVSDSTVELTDPAAPTAPQWYQVRALPTAVTGTAEVDSK